MEALEFREEGKTLSAVLSCEVDHHTAEMLRERMDHRLFSVRPERFVIDFSGVRFMDSSGIGLILGRLGVAEETGTRVTVTGLSPTLRKLLKLAGLEKIPELTINK